MVQLVWLTLLAVHIGAAGVWWWLMPGGFPSSSTEFWVNQVAPLVVAAILLTALFARGRLSEALLPPVLAAIPIFWMSFAVTSRIVFEDSFRSSWNGPFIGGAVLLVLWGRQFRARLRPLWVIPLIVVPAATAGWAFVGALRAPDPATAPSGAAFGEPPGGAVDQKVIKLTKDAQMRPADGRVVIRRDALVLNVQPMLSFVSRSPDRTWAALAPPESNVPTARTLKAKVRDGAGWRLFYKDEDASVVDVATRDGAVQIDARSRLPRPVFSHTNSFAELTIQGHHKLSVSFSPVPKERVEIASVTTPERFAYLDESGTFHVMQASERQRGPFTEIAAGAMKRSDPLVLTIYDGDKAMFSVALEDWAAQAATQLSPTAGWGIPVNAIELVRGGDPETAPALISLSLAATAIGRGSQTVGHTAGVYRNRMTVRLPAP